MSEREINEIHQVALSHLPFVLLLAGCAKNHGVVHEGSPKSFQTVVAIGTRTEA
jgi:hypothetical protein